VIDAPGWVLQVLVLLAGIGLPAVLLFAWAFEMTPEGLKRESEVDRSQSITSHTGRRLNTVIVAMALAVVGFFGVSRYMPSPGDGAAPELAIDDAHLPSSIAVLPFDDFSEAGDQEYFSNGISEEILNLLAKTGSLRVAARTSSFAFADSKEDIREIGRKLDVGTVLEGSIRKSGNTVRITAQLINVDDGYHLWSETYDRDYEDIFKIQDEIAANIMGALRVHLLGEEERTIQSERTADLDAYSAYLIGRERLELRTPGDVEAAQRQFEKAIELDPDYAPAHAALAQSWLVAEEIDRLGKQTDRKEVDAAVERHVARALELSPNLPEAVAIEGLHHLRRYRYQEARQAIDHALQLNPNYALAYTWRAEIAAEDERFLDMLTDKEKAYELDPMSLEVASDLAAVYRNFWRPEDAERVIQRMFELHPEHPEAYQAAVINLAFHARYGEAQLVLERAIEAHPDNGYFRTMHARSFPYLGMNDVATLPGDTHGQFEAALLQADFETADAILTEGLKQEDVSDWPRHGRQLYAVYESEDQEQRLRDFVSRDIERLEDEGIPWQDQCNIYLIRDLRTLGEGEKAESMMEKCRVDLEERFKARYLCPCTWYNVVLVTILDGRLEEAVERADFWLSNGGSNVGMRVDPVFSLLADRPEYGKLMARNARQIERQRELYLSGGGWAALEKPGEVAINR